MIEFIQAIALALSIVATPRGFDCDVAAVPQIVAVDCVNPATREFREFLFFSGRPQWRSGRIT